jgi:hypothetical protein
LCVSAETSFGLTGLLIPVGIYCIRIAIERDRSALPLSVVPLLFGVQQLCEGFVWVGIGRDSAELTQSAALFYLFFALTFWLFWIPFSAVFLEPENNRKFVLALGAILGLAGGLILYLPLLLDPGGLVVSVDRHSIQYNIAQFRAVEAIPLIVWQLPYLVVIALPLLVLGQKRRGMLVYSAALVLSAAISHVYFWYSFASVWCLFAAILSLMLGYVFHELPLPTNDAVNTSSATIVSTAPSGTNCRTLR